MTETSDCRFALTLLLCVGLGVVGAHRFYAGRWVTGGLMLLTGGGFLLWWVVDSLLIAFGAFSDAAGRPVQP